MDKWRSRVVIACEAILQCETYVVKEGSIRIVPLGGQESNNKVRLAEVTLSKQSYADIQSAFLRSFELCELFLDWVAIKSYGVAGTENWVSTTDEYVRCGSEFEILIPTHSYFRTSPTITPEHLQQFSRVEENSNLSRALSNYRQALMSPRIDDRFRLLYLAIEEIASSETQETQKRKCESCKSVVDTGIKATANKIKELINEEEQEQLSKSFREHRGRISHTGTKRDQKFIERSTKLAASIQGKVADVLLSRVGTKSLRQDDFVFYLPTTIHRFKALNHKDCSFISTKLNVSMQIAKAEEAEIQPGAFSQFGVNTLPSGLPQIPSAAWPEIEFMESVPNLVIGPRETG